MAIDLTTSISKLGNELVACKRCCKGIVCNSSSGQIPRCLYIETVGRSTGRGAAVVGLNPGGSSNDELQHYISENCTFQSVTNWFLNAKKPRQGREHPYYVRLRTLLDRLGLLGPILWTELVKCESESGLTEFPIQTLRTCTQVFLRRELGPPFPEDWPVFAVSREAFKSLAYLFPTRTVIGVPHPTGSWGQFPSLFEDFELGHIKEHVAKKAGYALNGAGQALWLDDKLE